MIRLRMEQRQTKKETRQQNLDFKQRVLDLLDVLACRASPPPAMLLLPLPLLKLLGSIAPRPSDRPLLDRTTSLLKNRISKIVIRGTWPREAVPPKRLLDELAALLALAEKMR